MITLLIASVLVLTLIVVAFYSWQKPAREFNSDQLTTPTPRSLFDAPREPANMTNEKEKVTKQVSKLIDRATSGDYESLKDASLINKATYDEVLYSLSKDADSEKLSTLASYISRHQLSASTEFANAFINVWQAAPNRVNTSKMLHVAALSNSAETFSHAIELVMQHWREKKPSDISSLELQALLSGEFWILSSGTRSSGAGYLLKQSLIAARQELDRN